MRGEGGRDQSDLVACRSTERLRAALGLGQEDTLFPWQQELLERFMKGALERSLDIPTGLGKTAVMAIWLVARAGGAKLPRRLVYVVDRRAVVDQATEVAMALRAHVDSDPEMKKALGLEPERSLPISTLRGKHVDNREWLEDPLATAIVVGTVDMIGSRILFEGYGVSRKMRPYHAGLLGVDTLVVLDEAHLVPPFEKLIGAVTDGEATFGPPDEKLRRLLPSFRLLALSATGRAQTGTSFGLQEADLRHPVVKLRIDATKRLRVDLLLDDETKLAEALAERAWNLVEKGKQPVRAIVFCDRRRVAEDAKKAIEKLSSPDRETETPAVVVDTELFVGGRRVFEREEAAKRLAILGFLAGAKVERTRPAFLFATSAGEVGVDLDADHMVSDLVAWERMVQRLGRVNRRGGDDRKAQVIVVVESPTSELEKARAKEVQERSAKDLALIADADRKSASRKLCERLPRQNGTTDASPRALRKLKQDATEDEALHALLDAATTPAPLRPALSRALVDAWSMTSLEEHTGRPEIGPWLRGWIQDDPPQTTVVWREHLPIREHGTATAHKEIEAFFEAAPPHTSEQLETEMYRVIEWLEARAKKLLSAPQKPATTASGNAEDDDSSPLGRNDVQEDSVVAIALTPAGDLRRALKLVDLAVDTDKKADKKRTEDLEGALAGATLVVDARMCGLTDGLLDTDSENRPRTADDGKSWIMTDSGTAPTVRFRVRMVYADQALDVDESWRERLRFVVGFSDDGEPKGWLIVEKWRHDAATEEDRSAARPQQLDEHQSWVEDRARKIGGRLALPDEYADMLAIAARLHDEGKRATRWQRAFNAPSDGVYAKTEGPINYRLLDGYRHELGSLPFAAAAADLRKLPDDLQDLALHLIVAHHGFARPVIGTRGCDDAPPSALVERAQEVALRFARLQKRWGPWGLAWWESLLRAADQQASRENDQQGSLMAKESY